MGNGANFKNLQVKETPKKEVAKTPALVDPLGTGAFVPGQSRPRFPGSINQPPASQQGALANRMQIPEGALQAPQRQGIPQLQMPQFDPMDIVDLLNKVTK